MTVPAVTSPTAATRPLRVRAAERRSGLVALARERLRRTWMAQLGAVLAWGATLVLAVVAAVLRVADGPSATLSVLVVMAAPWVAWLAAGPVALAAADDRARTDRRDGVLALAASRGATPGGLERARVAAAIQSVTSATALPLVGLALFVTAIGGTSAALKHLAATLLAAVFALACGVTLGGVAAACGRIGERRGRLLFLTVVLGPWMILDLVGRGAWSIPGALGALLDLGVRLAGLERGA